MAKKERVSFVRAQDFETIEDELTEAMTLLDEANSRVLDLLTVEGYNPEAEKTAQAPEGIASPVGDAEEQAETPGVQGSPSSP